MLGPWLRLPSPRPSSPLAVMGVSSAREAVRRESWHRPVLHGMTATSALLVVSSPDAPLARHFLPPVAAGEIRGAHDLQQGSPRAPAFVVTVVYCGWPPPRLPGDVGPAVSATAAITSRWGPGHPRASSTTGPALSAGLLCPSGGARARSSPPSGDVGPGPGLRLLAVASGGPPLRPAVLGGRDRRDRAASPPTESGPTGLDALRRQLPGGARGTGLLAVAVRRHRAGD